MTPGAGERLSEALPGFLEHRRYIAGYIRRAHRLRPDTVDDVLGELILMLSQQNHVDAIAKVGVRVWAKWRVRDVIRAMFHRRRAGAVRIIPESTIPVEELDGEAFTGARFTFYVEEGFAASDLREDLLAAIASIPDARVRDIVRRRMRGASLPAIARVHGLTYERVWQLYKGILPHLAFRLSGY